MARVVSEVLQNTRSVQLAVLGVPAGAAVRLRLDRVQERAVVECEAACLVWEALLPGAVEWSAPVQETRMGGTVVLRVSLAPLGPTQSVLLGPAAELRGLALPRLQQVNTTVACRACRAPLIAHAPFERVLRLPSPYWQELAELWGCHTETFEAAPNKPIAIAPGVFYLGPSFMAVHDSHVANIVHGQAEGSSSTATVRICCAKCGACVGERPPLAKDYVRLHLHAVDNGRGLWNDRTVCARLAGGLMDMAHGAGEHRFVTRLGLHLVCINWDTAVAVEPATKPRPVLKLAYGNQAGDDLGGWVSLSWTEEECRVFSQELDSNREKYMAPELAVLGKRQLSFVWM